MNKDIFVHDYGGYPFTYQLAAKLSERYKVTYIYCSGSGSSKGNKYSDEVGLKCIDLMNKPVDKANFIKRFFDEFNYGKKLKDLVSSSHVDVMLSANTPTIPQYIIQNYCKKNNIKFVFWLHDIISVAARSVFLKKNKILSEIVYMIWAFFESRALRNSDSVITITEDFNKYMKKWDVADSKIFCIPNWSSIDDIPLKDKANDFSKRLNIESTFNIIYSGTLGYKHNPDILYNAAAKLEAENAIMFVIISEGLGANRLKELNLRHSLNNLIILPYQPYELLSEVLGSADLIISILEPSAGLFSVPSKVWTGFCAGRASLLLVPKDNLAAKITTTINAGVIIDNENISKLVETILFLKSNPDLLKLYGINARKYAEENFNIDLITENFEKILDLD